MTLAFSTHAIDTETMETVKVSPKFQVVIPRKVREQLNVRAGQEVQVSLYEDRIEFIPLKPMKQMRGFLKGIDTTVEREKDQEGPVFVRRISNSISILQA